jgi:hypothetical protein
MRTWTQFGPKALLVIGMPSFFAKAFRRATVAMNNGARGFFVQ